MTIHMITGTDTEVGKTVVTAALAVILSSRGSTVSVVKPAQTGVGPNDPGDIQEVRRLAGPVDLREGVRLPDPLAPDTAARVAGIELPDISHQRDLLLTEAATHDDVLVEGAGGITVNLGQAWNLLDLADTLTPTGHRVEFVVVARAGLGTLNHSRLTVDAIQHRGLLVRGIVIGSWPNHPGPAELHNRDDIANHTGVPVLGLIPANASRLDPRDFQAHATCWIPSIDIDQPSSNTNPTAHG